MWRHDVKITVVQSDENHAAAHGFGEFHCSDILSLLRGFKTRVVLGFVWLYNSVCHFMTEVARRV
jgi:hypothetical protein